MDAIVVMAVVARLVNAKTVTVKKNNAGNIKINSYGSTRR